VCVRLMGPPLLYINHIKLGITHNLDPLHNNLDPLHEEPAVVVAAVAVAAAAAATVRLQHDPTGASDSQPTENSQLCYERHACMAN
jgi:hypothetical protein